MATKIKIPRLHAIPQGIAPWRQAKALRLRERREQLVRAAIRATGNDHLGTAESILGNIRELDGEIRGLEEMA